MAPLFNRSKTRRRSASTPPSTSALIAAASVYHPAPSSRDSSLAAASAAAALRNAATPPPDRQIGSIPTKRMLQRRDSYSSMTSDDHPTSSPIARRPSTGSMSMRERSFRKPSPARSDVGASTHMPTTLREPKKVQSSGSILRNGSLRGSSAPPPSARRRRSSLMSEKEYEASVTSLRSDLGRIEERGERRGVESVPEDEALESPPRRVKRPLVQEKRPARELSPEPSPMRVRRVEKETPRAVRSPSPERGHARVTRAQEEERRKVRSPSPSPEPSPARVRMAAKAVQRTVRSPSPEVKRARSPSPARKLVKESPPRARRRSSPPPDLNAPAQRLKSIDTSVKPAKTEATLSPTSIASPRAGSPNRQAHFTTSPQTAVKHSPPPRSVSPAKSALKNANNIYAPPSPTSDARRIARVSFSDEDSVASFTNSRPPPVGLEEVANHERTLPSFGSVKRTKKGEVVNTISPPPSPGRRDVDREVRREIIAMTPPTEEEGEVPELRVIQPTPREEVNDPINKDSPSDSEEVFEDAVEALPVTGPRPSSSTTVQRPFTPPRRARPETPPLPPDFTQNRLQKKQPQPITPPRSQTKPRQRSPSPPLRRKTSDSSISSFKRAHPRPSRATRNGPGFRTTMRVNNPPITTRARRYSSDSDDEAPRMGFRSTLRSGGGGGKENGGWRSRFADSDSDSDTGGHVFGGALRKPTPQQVPSSPESAKRGKRRLRRGFMRASSPPPPVPAPTSTSTSTAKTAMSQREAEEIVKRARGDSITHDDRRHLRNRDSEREEAGVLENGDKGKGKEKQTATPVSPKTGTLSKRTTAPTITLPSVPPQPEKEKEKERPKSFFETLRHPRRRRGSAASTASAPAVHNVYDPASAPPVPALPSSSSPVSVRTGSGTLKKERDTRVRDVKFGSVGKSEGEGVKVEAEGNGVVKEGKVDGEKEKKKGHGHGHGHGLWGRLLRR